MSNEITTPYDRVLIDPNEPLILPDGTAITGRLETFLYALCCLDYDNLPTPLSRIEEFANALITGEIPNIEPQSRSEQFFLAILDGNIDNLPEPQSRSEVLLNKLALGDFDLTNVDPIQSRYELLLAYLIKNGGVGNLDYVLYEFYQATQTLYNTQEKPVKSAILSGNTLVNLLNSSNFVNTDYAYKINDVITVISRDNSAWYNCTIPINNATQNSTYIVCWDNLTYTHTDNRGTNQLIGVYGFDDSNTQITIKATQLNQTTNYLIFTIPSTVVSEVSVRIHASTFTGQQGATTTIKGLKVIEYQDGMENWDIPYFEGMQSVKMPVLTTTGKNLISVNHARLDEIHDNTGKHTENLVAKNIPVTPGKTYTVSYSVSSSTNVQTINITRYEHQEKTNSNNHWGLWNEIGIDDDRLTFTIPQGINYISFTFGNAIYTNDGIPGWIQFDNIQLEDVSVATEYEPYKSNILTVNEPVELRAIDGVKDELNLLTGELTQRIGEIVLDGVSVSLTMYKETDEFITGILSYEFFDDIIGGSGGTQNTDILGDSKKYLTSSFSFNQHAYNAAGEGRLFDPSANLFFCISKSKLSTVDIDGFNIWLSRNPIKIKYQLATESVKTVDLSVIDQDGNVLPKIKTFNDITHVNVSSDGILPKVEMEVATYNEEDIANANVMTASMDEIYSVQNELDNTNSIQSEEIDSTMIASTEIYENIL